MSRISTVCKYDLHRGHRYEVMPLDIFCLRSSPKIYYIKAKGDVISNQSCLGGDSSFCCKKFKRAKAQRRRGSSTGLKIFHVGCTERTDINPMDDTSSAYFRRKRSLAPDQPPMTTRGISGSRKQAGTRAVNGPCTISMRFYEHSTHIKIYSVCYLKLFVKGTADYPPPFCIWKTPKKTSRTFHNHIRNVIAAPFSASQSSFDAVTIHL